MNYIYYKFVPDNYVLSDNILIPKSEKTWLKYQIVNDKNTHYISYLMKQFFAKSDTITYEIKYNEYFKPIINNGFFNISHDHNLCVGIYDANTSIGIDVVYTKRNTDLSILKSVFNIDEPHDIYQFCRKEAYIKMIGKGLYMDLLDVKIICGKIYFKNILEPYDIFETQIDDYFICVIGKFDQNMIKLREFDL